MGKVDKPSENYQKKMNLVEILDKMENEADQEADEDNEEEIAALANLTTEEFSTHEDERHQSQIQLVLGRHAQDVSLRLLPLRDAFFSSFILTSFITQNIYNGNAKISCSIILLIINL